MRIVGMLLWAGLLVVPGLRAEERSPDGDTVNAGLKELQGTWELVAIKSGDQERPAPTGLKLSLVIKGDRCTTKSGDRAGTEAKVVVDSSKRPKTIDLKRSDGRNAAGIYELKGDRLQICFASVNQPRPADFSAEKTGRSSIMIYKKVKP